jgi:hypothetical protein
VYTIWNIRWQASALATQSEQFAHSKASSK